MTEKESKHPSNVYRVLARAYRPQTFDDLIGQEALVRTLSNAISTGRLAHAFLLTGIRGVGKTTTARIIAKALNCTGHEGEGATISPCGTCDNCLAIAEDRHVDVLEMDAASHTGVNDIRDLIDTVHYNPVAARYKVYIIDEVHMLSTSAFNALLKTLEEPPERVVFIFATTEIRKIPVTILSRCQRFDLRRIDTETLTEHLGAICQKEGVEVEEAARALIAGAAEGSVRDALSLLDQAIAHGGRNVSGTYVQEMLGLTDRGRSFDLFALLMAGNTAEALDMLGSLYAAGADPLLVLQDLLEVTHLVTRLKVTPELRGEISLPELSRQRGMELAEKLAMGVLGRAWQMLIKGIDEVRMAPNALQAAEMVLVRLAYASGLPTPAELLREGKKNSPTSAAAGVGVSGATGSAGGRAQAYTQHAPSGTIGESSSQNTPPVMASASPVLQVVSGGRGSVAAARALQPGTAELHQEEQKPSLSSFDDVIALFETKKEALLAARLRQDVRLVRFSEGTLEIQTTPDLPLTFGHDVGNRLSEWTGRRWVVVLSNKQGGQTIQEKREEALKAEISSAAEHPDVQRVMNAFEGANIITMQNYDSHTGGKR